MYKLAELYASSASVADYAPKYVERLHEVLGGIDVGILDSMVDCIDQASRAGHRLYLVANGGSAGVAAHIVNDLVAGGYAEGTPPFRALCLSDNVPSVTALANDAGYDNVFERQLRVHLEPGDVVLAMSVSGNSENVVRAIVFARERGATTLGWCGFEGGRLAEACDLVAHVPTTKDEYGPVEDAFSVLGHILCGFLTMRHGKMLHH
ncbi:MAG TPA: SIS domain-containing protein [Candidatus Hydrogenedentes bacterium]|nr:SIS domain-containing protein [Candidatus Hydrogenedentota bacterium]